jgi:hypothetical protein
VIIFKHIWFTGMFPYVCIVTMPIFCDANWPRKMFKIFSVSPSADQDKKSTSPLPTAGKFQIKIKH